MSWFQQINNFKPVLSICDCDFFYSVLFQYVWAHLFYEFVMSRFRYICFSFLRSWGHFHSSSYDWYLDKIRARQLTIVDLNIVLGLVHLGLLMKTAANFSSTLGYDCDISTACLALSFFFSIRLLSVLRGHSVVVFSFPPQRPITSHFEGFSIPDLIHYIFFVLS